MEENFDFSAKYKCQKKRNEIMGNYQHGDLGNGEHAEEEGHENLVVTLLAFSSLEAGVMVRAHVVAISNNNVDTNVLTADGTLICRNPTASASDELLILVCSSVQHDFHADSRSSGTSISRLLSSLGPGAACGCAGPSWALFM
jgi:hypothetical protein